MTFYKFEEDDLFTNTIEAYPQYSFYIQSGSLYVDNIPNITSSTNANILNVPQGETSLYEMNINRSNNFIHPFVVKNSNRDSFKKIKKEVYNSSLTFDGQTAASSYRMSASLSRDYFSTTTRSS